MSQPDVGKEFRETRRPSPCCRSRRKLIGLGGLGIGLVLLVILVLVNHFAPITVAGVTRRRSSRLPRIGLDRACIPIAAPFAGLDAIPPAVLAFACPRTKQPGAQKFRST